MYGNIYNPQASIDRINNQIAELEKMKQQIPMQQPTNLTQNFQIAPTNQGAMRYANTIEEVSKEFVIGDTPFFSKDMSVVWIKDIKGEVKSYELKEIVIKDDKDLMIENLQAQIIELSNLVKEKDYEQYDTEYVEQPISEFIEPIEVKKPTSIQSIRRNKKK